MDHIIEWAFQGVMTSCVMYGAVTVSRKSTEITNSINKLNNTVTKILERISWHQRELERLDERVKDLENKK